MNPRAAAQRLCEGSTTLCRRGAAWAAAQAAAIGRDPRILAYATAAWTWAAWRRPTPPHKPPTSDDSSEKGHPGGGGEGMSIIKTVNGTAVRRPHPDHPNRTIIEWKDQT
jgi:hypothetical protein